MRKSIKEIAHKIGMQNQYLGLAINDKKVIGELNPDYHSDKSWVDIDSVKDFVKYRYENYQISEEQYKEYMYFLDRLTE